ncbi:MAG: hypothetical protein WCO54_04565 [Bacteroidota bacterium]
MKTTIAILFVFTLFASCKQDKKFVEPLPTPPPYYVSGDYLVRDSTHNVKVNYPDTPYMKHFFYDSNYVLHIDYVDTVNNIIRINNVLDFQLRQDNSYSFWYTGAGGYSSDTMNLNNNKIFYISSDRAGGNTYFTKIIGTKMK